MSFGLPLRDEGDDKCLSILNSVEETISRQLRACKAQASSKKKTLEGTRIKFMLSKTFFPVFLGLPLSRASLVLWKLLQFKVVVAYFLFYCKNCCHLLKIFLKKYMCLNYLIWLFSFELVLTAG
jgi:hypothetical protein